MVENTLQDLEEKYTTETGVPCCDSLTGLYSYGFFQLSLDQQIGRHKQSSASFSLALLDLDYFSEYNQKNGVLQGDRLLQDVARIIRNSLLETGFAARLHNDTFAILHPQSTVQHTASLLKKISSDIQTFVNDTITVSVGLSSFPEQAINKEGLFQVAEQQLRRAKTGIVKISYAEKDPEGANSQNPSRVLIVDDEERNVKLLEALLLPLGYKIFKATSGNDALKMVGRTDIDLILLDIMMPGVNGYDVCRTLKNRDSSRMIPIIMITALDDIEAKIKGIEAGADDFLTKPPNKVELLTRTRSLLKTKRLNEKLTDNKKIIANLIEEKARSEKLASLTTLAAGAAHEFSTPLSAIAVAAGEMLYTLKEGDFDQDLVDDAHLIREQVRRCHDILYQMSADAGGHLGEEGQVFSVNKLLDAVAEDIKLKFTGILLIDNHVDNMTIQVPWRTIQRTISGLVKNSFDASPAESPVQLTCRNDSKFLYFTVKDEGSGMDESVLARASEPFFTTREPGKGLGLGLFLARSFVEKFGGGLTLLSEQGQGAEVTISFDLDVVKPN